MTDTTFKELLEMRAKLNEALKAKIGKKPDVGFQIIVGAYNDRVAFCRAYTHKIETQFCVEGSLLLDPREAFNSAMEAIDAVPATTLETRRAELLRELAELEGE